MSIMACPKCGGGGFIVGGNVESTAGRYNMTCPSCQGAGYVTDTPQSTIKDLGAELVSAYIQCPHCGGTLKIVPEFWKVGKKEVI